MKLKIWCKWYSLMCAKNGENIFLFFKGKENLYKFSCDSRKKRKKCILFRKEKKIKQKTKQAQRYLANKNTLMCFCACATFRIYFF